MSSKSPISSGGFDQLTHCSLTTLGSWSTKNLQQILRNNSSIINMILENEEIPDESGQYWVSFCDLFSAPLLSMAMFEATQNFSTFAVRKRLPTGDRPIFKCSNISYTRHESSKPQLKWTRCNGPTMGLHGHTIKLGAPRFSLSSILLSEWCSLVCTSQKLYRILSGVTAKWVL